ncbi:erythroferrone-like [Varroa jacobsoni]|uniref:erythroferrone-like n=1 Tax=Varroa jacobsoni TaxID=62625 RepID=UPI000BF771BC|nr:erythroferrone-like [Varroa jacobsoni]
MAITCLVCSLTALVALLLVPPDGWQAAFVEASSNSDAVSALEALGYRNVQPSMLKATAPAEQTHQQAILLQEGRQQQLNQGAISRSAAGQRQLERSTTIKPETIIMTSSTSADLLVEGDHGNYDGMESIEKLKLAEEERQWDEHLAASAHKRIARRQGSSGKHKRRLGVVLDPRKTWQAFLRHTERQQEREKQRNKKATAHKKVNAAHLRMHGQAEEIELPPRPDANPFNSGMTREQMIQHMRDLIKEAADRHLQKNHMCRTNSTKPECTDQSPNGATSPVVGSPLFEFERAVLVPETQSAFTWRLAHALKVRRQREAELHAFYRPYIVGAFERGDGLRADQGRFTAPAGGVYVFNAQIHFNVTFGGSARAPNANAGGTVHYSDGSVALKLCIDANCTANFALSAMRSINHSGTFTLALGGPIHLTAGQSVSLFVVNKAWGAVVRVLEDSTFSGFMTSYL